MEKSYIAHQDYCNILWAPVSNKGDLLAQEGPQRAFTKKAWGQYHLHYWERLKNFRIYSIQRRVERFKCIYLWKMYNGIVPDVGLRVNMNTNNTRSGQILQTRALKAKSDSIKTKMKDSLLYNGVRLFNSLPRYVSGVKDDIQVFKSNLDNYLSMFPDQPEIPGSLPEATDIYGKQSNSIIDWARYYGINDDFSPDDG